MPESPNTTTCPNCGLTHSETDHYCPSCGQKSSDSIISFKEMFLDAMGAFFAFDSKAIRSIPKLLFHPGTLTVEYIGGKRESYLAPFRMYLFVSIVLFLVLPLVVSDKDLFNGSLADAPQALDSLIQIASEDSSIDKNSTILTGEAAFDTLLNELAAQKKTKHVNWTIDKDPNSSVIQFSPSDTAGEGAWNVAVDMVENGMPIGEAVDSVFSEQGRWARLLMKQGMKLQSSKGEGLVHAFLDKASYTLFIFLPIFALFLKLLYMRRKRFYIEHLVFALHYFSFFFIVVVLYVLIYRFIWHIPFWPVFVIGLVYLYLSMLKVYRQRWGRTLFKWIVLNFTTTVFFLPVFFMIALVISLLFY